MEADVLLVTHSSVTENIESLKVIQTQMHHQYKEYTERNKTTKVFGLDSFHYQCRLLDLEIKHLNEQYAFINNRMYCDYYKLYNMVKQFYKDGFKLEPKKRTFTIYKDLEQFKVFDFNDILQLNKEIIEMITTCYDVISKTEEEITMSMSKTKPKFNIDPFILNHRYNNSILKTKIELYEKYLDSYHIYHMSFLSHLLDKLALLFRQSTNPVNIEKIEDWNHRSVMVEETEDTLKKEFVMVNEDLSQNKVENVVWTNPIPSVLSPLQKPENLHISVSEPVSEPVSETVPEPVPEPVSEPVPEPVPEPVADPVADPVSEPVADPVADPVPEPVADPVADPVPEPVADPVPEPVADPVPEPVADPVPDPVAEPVPEHVSIDEEPDESVTLLESVKEPKKKKKKRR